MIIYGPCVTDPGGENSQKDSSFEVMNSIEKPVPPTPNPQYNQPVTFLDPTLQLKASPSDPVVFPNQSTSQNSTSDQLVVPLSVTSSSSSHPATQPSLEKNTISLSNTNEPEADLSTHDQLIILTDDVSTALRKICMQ